MKIDFELTSEDWLDFNKYYFFNSKEIGRTKLFVQLSVPVSVALILIYNAFKGSLDKTGAIIGLSFGLLWFFFYPKKFYRETIKKIEKLMKEGDNSSLFGKHSIVFDENGVTCAEPESTQTFKWSAFKKAVETKNHFFLFNTAMSAIIIPKKTILSEVESIRNLINLNIKESNLQK